MALSKNVQDARSKANNFREDYALIMQPYANWEEYLTPAPLSIALLGQLIRISAEDDFSVNKNVPKGGFEFIRYPESFKACLMQVCNSGWQAFNEAHKNMDQIRLYTGMVPDYIKKAVEIILQEDDVLVQAFLPVQIESIDNVATECLQLATKTEGWFSDVINLMKELLEALINAKQGYVVELGEIKKSIEAAKIKKTTAENENERAKEAYAKVIEELDEAKDNYKKTMDSLPSGWDILGQKVLTHLLQQSILVLSGVTTTLVAGKEANYINSGINAITVVTSGIKDIVQASKAESPTTVQNIPVEKINLVRIFAKCNFLLVLTTQMAEICDENKINWVELYDKEKKTTKSDFLKEMFEKVKQDVNKEGDCEVKTQALNICDKAISVCTELAIYAPKGESDDTKTKELIEDIKKLNIEAVSFDSASKAYTNSPPLSVEPPHSSQQQSSASSENSLIENLARLRMEQSQTLLKMKQEMYEKNLKDMEQKQKKLDEVLIELMQFDLKEKDFNTKIKMLAKGLEAMGDVKEQWKKVVHFFQMISNIIKTVLTQNLKNFTGNVQIAAKINYTHSMFVKDTIYNNALCASAIANLVNMISTSYTEVSVQYLMGSVSALGKLMTMDSSTTQFTAEMEKLQQDCTSAKEGIRTLVEKNKKDFNTRCHNRITQIEETIKASLSEKPVEKKLYLKNAVQEGMKAVTWKPEETKPQAE